MEYVVRKVGEGFGKPDGDITSPIEIRLSALTARLVRQLLRHAWLWSLDSFHCLCGCQPPMTKCCARHLSTAASVCLWTDRQTHKEHGPIFVVTHKEHGNLYQYRGITVSFMPQVELKLVTKDWHRRLSTLHQVAQAAWASLDAAARERACQETGAALDTQAEATEVDYFAAVCVRDELAKTAERGVLGGLTGEAGRWQQIVRAYETQSALPYADSTPRLPVAHGRWRHEGRQTGKRGDAASRRVGAVAPNVAPRRTPHELSLIHI